ncbi:MAG: hypothetical protein ACLGIF_06120 [Actinomycetes bacterium]
MSISAAGLVRSAAVAAVTAGTLYVAVQVNHPPMELASVATTEWVLRNAAKVIMAALALAGVTGMYATRRRRVGVLGLVGYLLFAVGFLAMFGVALIAATVLPALATANPGYVTDVLVAAEGGAPAGDIGGLQAVLGVSGVGYMVGGLMFGLALYRGRALARWASLLLAVGTIGTLALAVLPETLNRPLAVPVGIALIGLGASLWRSPLDADTPSLGGARTTAEVVAR